MRTRAWHLTLARQFRCPRAMEAMHLFCRNADARGICSPESHGNRSRLDLVTLAIETDSNGDSLLRRARPYDRQSSDDDNDETGSNIRLLSTPCGLRFTIPGGLSEEDAPVKELPRAIMLEVENCERLPDIPFVFSDPGS